jgi:hypothetical protein
MATEDIRVWDGSAWVSIAGADGDPGASVKDATAAATPVDPKPDGSLGDPTADVTETADVNGDLTLAFDFGIPTGLPGSDGESAETNVGNISTNTISAGQNASVTITDTDTGPNATLDFTFNIPRGEDGTGVNILGEKPTEGDLPATGNPGDAWLIGGDLYVWDADNNSWVNVGSIQGPAGDSAEVHVGNVTTSTLTCGDVATVDVQTATGSTPSNLTMDFDFGIPSSSVDAGNLTLSEACTADGLTGSFTNTGNTSCAVFDLDLSIPTFKATSSTEGNAPADPCPGHMWIVTS